MGKSFFTAHSVAVAGRASRARSLSIAIPVERHPSFSLHEALAAALHLPVAAVLPAFSAPGSRGHAGGTATQVAAVGRMHGPRSAMVCIALVCGTGEPVRACRAVILPARWAPPGSRAGARQRRSVAPPAATMLPRAVAGTGIRSRVRVPHVSTVEHPWAARGRGVWVTRAGLAVASARRRHSSRLRVGTQVAMGTSRLSKTHAWLGQRGIAPPAPAPATGRTCRREVAPKAPAGRRGSRTGRPVRVTGISFPLRPIASIERSARGTRIWSHGSVARRHGRW
eukprot:scaffold726_cov262-Pinguiococcus_pyrenoidosus.AAC.14